jgi:predicted Rossmann fold nucleotide-binding protein DprA/Smf involved in DNA uptake
MFSKLNPIEQQVMQWLLNGIHNPDDMLNQNQWSASHISMALLDLELKGLITNLPGNQYMSMI